MNNILDFQGNQEDGEGEIDYEYFRELIEHKLSGDQESYQEQFAVKQMSGEWDPEEELQNALDEIKKMEKEGNMIAMVAQTLFEQHTDQRAKISEQENEITDFENQTEVLTQRFEDMNQELENK